MKARILKGRRRLDRSELFKSMAQVTLNESSSIQSVEDAGSVLSILEELVQDIGQHCAMDDYQSEEEFDATVKPKVDEATARSQKLAAYLQENKKMKDHAEFKKLHRKFVSIMKDFQSAHNQVASKRESVCDQAMLQEVKVSVAELQIAKEEEAKAIKIAEDAVEVKELYKEVNTLVHDQTSGIEQVSSNVQHTKLEIGGGVDELEQANRLQKEARQKKIAIILLLIAILAVIIVPIVLQYV